jgi:thioredoxin 1
LANEYKNVLFFKINVDDNDVLTKEYDICSMPTIIFLKNGLVAKKIVGVNVDGIKETLMEFETFSSENLCLGC